MKTKEISLYELADRMGTAHRVEVLTTYSQLKERSSTYGTLRDKIDIFIDNLEMHQGAQYAQTVKNGSLNTLQGRNQEIKDKISNLYNQYSINI